MESEGIKKNQSLRKALSILEVMTEIDSPARLQDITRKVKMSPSTVLRFLNTYIDYGYVGQEEDTNYYYLTLKLSALGIANSKNFPFQKVLSKYVMELSRKFKESSSLAVESDMQMVYIVSVEGPERTLQTLQRIGRIAPMHATGVGKLHLLNYSHHQLEQLKEKRGLKKLTNNTITSLEELILEIEKIRSNGYAIDNEECEPGVKCIAVPIHDYTGKVVAAISVSVPIPRLGLERMNEIVSYLLKLGMSASSKLGWQNEIPLYHTPQAPRGS